MAENEVRERRVTALEQEVEGEKLVTGHILEQTRRNGDDIGRSGRSSAASRFAWTGRKQRSGGVDLRWRG
jgi:hypothetical protein